MQLAPIAKYKIAWWKDGKTIHSAMFDQLSDAVNFARSKKREGFVTTLMELKHSDSEHGRYDWILHAFDAGDFLHIFTLIYRHRLLISLGLGSLYLHKRRS